MLPGFDVQGGPDRPEVRLRFRGADGAGVNDNDCLSGIYEYACGGGFVPGDGADAADDELGAYIGDDDKLFAGCDTQCFEGDECTAAKGAAVGHRADR